VDKTGLANEDLENGRCERCGSLVEKKPMRQWVLRITDYADRMLSDLEKLPHWEPSIKLMQKNWIGRSEGAEINFRIENSEEYIKVFTTRVDTIFGCTYVVLAPENPLLEKICKQITNWNQALEYIEKVKNKSDLERTDLNKDKSGVLLEGITAVNPFNGEKVAVYIADYVLNSYGTGAVMAVPAHDERDFEFAQKYGITIRQSVQSAPGAQDNLPFCDEGVTVNSGEFEGLSSAEARQKMISWLKKTSNGTGRVNYKLKDWVFSRQRYWGEPIPIIHCEKCGPVAVPEKDLPVRLPDVKEYEPSGTGESPLATITDWVNTTCPHCGGPGKRETNTMPQWAGSSWYYLRYIDPKNDQALVDPKLEKHWSPVDFYVGGAEHATRHLIYARFWHKFLFDIGAVAHDEPFTRLQHVGLIMGEDGQKMSKRWGNVVNPDQVVAEYGADALRIYEMFMGPFDQPVSWSTRGLVGARRFLDKVEQLAERLDPSADASAAAYRPLLIALNKTIKKVGEDIEEFKFNTAISQMMILVNEMSASPLLPRSIYENFLLVLAPFAPFTTEELWSKIGNQPFIHRQKWPAYDPALILDEAVSVSVQVNGKLRGVIQVPRDTAEADVIKAAQTDANIGKYLADGYKKHIYVPNKILNFVV
jgi:leucyl-tRNA synthetase